MWAVEIYYIKIEVMSFGTCQCTDENISGSVQDLYRVNGPLSENQIAFVSRETLKGLSYLHMRHTVHRDIKVFVTISRILLNPE